MVIQTKEVIRNHKISSLEILEVANHWIFYLIKSNIQTTLIQMPSNIDNLLILSFNKDYFLSA